MSDRDNPPALVVGKPTKSSPEIHFWLEETRGGIWLCARHDGDSTQQNLILIERDGEVLRAFSQGIYTPALWRAFGLSKGGRIHLSEWGVVNKPAKRRSLFSRLLAARKESQQ